MKEFYVKLKIIKFKFHCPICNMSCIKTWILILHKLSLILSLVPSFIHLEVTPTLTIKFGIYYFWISSGSRVRAREWKSRNNISHAHAYHIKVLISFINPIFSKLYIYSPTSWACTCIYLRPLLWVGPHA
jgi:hypothetical protein